MFEKLSPVLTLRSVPTPASAPAPGDGLLLCPVAAPPEGEMWSFAAREVEVAARDGWRAVRVLAWTWNPTGHPVLWRCAVDLGGAVGWYAYDARLIRPLNCAGSPQ